MSDALIVQQIGVIKEASSGKNKRYHIFQTGYPLPQSGWQLLKIQLFAFKVSIVLKEFHCQKAAMRLMKEKFMSIQAIWDENPVTCFEETASG